MDKLFDKRNAPLFVAALGTILFLPLLSAFGLWDPHEVRFADAAKEIVQSGGWPLQSRVAGGRPPLGIWLVVAGFRTVGLTELGGRLPIALTAILGLVVVYYLGAGFLRRRAAVLGAVVLATSPAYLLGARQLTSNVAAVLAVALALAGLARAAWPTSDEPMSRRLLHLALGLVGLGLGFFAGGLLLGVAVPVTALALALAAAGGSRRLALLTTLVAAGLLGAVVWAWQASLPGAGRGGYSVLLGGAPHAGNHLVQLVALSKHLGFGLAPWIALAPLAAARAFTLRTDDGGSDEAARRERFGTILLLLVTIVAYVAATLYQAVVGEVAFPAGAAVALLIGWYLDDALDATAPQGFPGLVAALGAIVLAHDFFLQPESWGGAHVVEGIKWPSPLEIAPFVILALCVAFGLLVGVGLALHPGGSLNLRRRLLWGAQGSALLLALLTAFWITPDVSKHLSFKGLFTKYQRLGGADTELGRYRVPASVVWGQSAKSTELVSLAQLFEFLAKPSRVFVTVSADELAPIDQYAKSQAKAASGQASPYYVVDDSNVHFLLLSNRLGTGEQDLNALRRQVIKSLARPPQFEVHADFEGKVELVGYDLPSELDRGKSFKITLYYLVKQPLTSSYKVFLHFDGPGTRFNGDHVPLNGRFPTNYWVPGYYVVDEHPMEADRAMAPSGFYQIYGGFFLGGDRLKVTTAHDGEHRVKLGGVRIK